MKALKMVIMILALGIIGGIAAQAQPCPPGYTDTCQYMPGVYIPEYGYYCNFDVCYCRYFDYVQQRYTGARIISIRPLGSCTSTSVTPGAVEEIEKRLASESTPPCNPLSPLPKSYGVLAPLCWYYDADGSFHGCGESTCQSSYMIECINGVKVISLYSRAMYGSCDNAQSPTGKQCTDDISPCHQDNERLSHNPQPDAMR